MKNMKKEGRNFTTVVVEDWMAGHAQKIAQSLKSETTEKSSNVSGPFASVAVVTNDEGKLEKVMVGITHNEFDDNGNKIDKKVVEREVKTHDQLVAATNQYVEEYVEGFAGGPKG